MANHLATPPIERAMRAEREAQKRKRSLSPDQSGPATKAVRTQLQINYLVRHNTDLLPLVSSEHDSLPVILSTIAQYDGVLQRHESMAGNLGARPLGPILIQRFERLFDGPPKVLITHGKEGTTVGWLDVVEFARNKPEQFNLEKMRDGVRVCQFYTKQCRVEISEDDFDLISSGIPQKMIPPQPISDDEEKELGTLEILEKTLGGLVHLADQVSGRARQLNHRLKNRKSAIINRRIAERWEAAKREESTQSPDAPSGNSNARMSVSPTSGFVAVNAKDPIANGSSLGDEHTPTASIPSLNGLSSQGASAATRADLLSKFHTNSDRTSATRTEMDQARRTSKPMPPSFRSQIGKSKASAEQLEYSNFLNNTASPVPIPNTPSSLLPYVKPAAADRFDDSGPYKADMMLRMEQLNRGDRVQPPCDRCRRLHMDCLKNLTACMGCTRKHAKCSWKDVEPQELKDHPLVLRKTREAGEDKGSDGEVSRREKIVKDWDREDRGVRDEELLGEEESEDEEPSPPNSGYASGALAREIEMEEAAAARKNGGAESDPRATDAHSSTINGFTPAIRYYSAHEWDELNEFTPANLKKAQADGPADTGSSSPKRQEEPMRVYTAGSEPLPRHAPEAVSAASANKLHGMVKALEMDVDATDAEMASTTEMAKHAEKELEKVREALDDRNTNLAVEVSKAGDPESRRPVANPSADKQIEADVDGKAAVNGNAYPDNGDANADPYPLAPAHADEQPFEYARTTPHAGVVQDDPMQI